MLKQVGYPFNQELNFQPPSGGCVLKQSKKRYGFFWKTPAAFGRLCVETSTVSGSSSERQPAAFGRLCVETIALSVLNFESGPAAFGRLCVETFPLVFELPPEPPAAFGRLCVET